MSSRTYLSIGDVLTLLREEFPDVTISKIRFLESQGLVNPERSPSGYRKFFEADVERLRWVLRQQREHFLPLKVIRDRLDAGDLSEGAGEPVTAGSVAATPVNGKAPARAHAVAGAGVSGRSRSGGLGTTTAARAEGRTQEQSTQADDEAMARILADASRRAARVPESARQHAPLQAVPDPGAPHSAGHTDVLNVPREHDAAASAAAASTGVTEGLRADPDAPHPEGVADTAGGASTVGTGGAGAHDTHGRSSPRASATAPATTEPGAPRADVPGDVPGADRPGGGVPSGTARPSGGVPSGGVPGGGVPSGTARPIAGETGPAPAAQATASATAPSAPTAGAGAVDAAGTSAPAAGSSGASAARGAAGRGTGAQSAGVDVEGAAGRTETGRQGGADKRTSGAGGPAGTAAGSAKPSGGRGGSTTGTPPASTSGTVTGASLTSEELCAASGLSEIELAGLQGFGLIEPTMVAGIPTFDEDALTVANLAAAFRKYGIEARHLRPYRNAVDRETGLIEQVIIPLLRQRNPESRQRAVDAADELGALGQTMRATLLRTALRRHVGG